MPYYTDRYSTEASNILPSGKAGVALAVGDLVYMDSNGQWQKADSVAVGDTTRKDAQGVIVQTALQYQMVSPVKVADIRGYSGMTVGAKVYLSATAGEATTTAPTATIQQVVGFARSASIIRFDIGGANAGGMDVGGDMSFNDIEMFEDDADATSAVLTMKKIRAAAVVQSGDDLGMISFKGYDGDSYAEAAQILAEVGGTPGDGDMPGKISVKISPDGAEAVATVAEFTAADMAITSVTEDAVDSTISFKKARAAAIVQDNDDLGGINFKGSNGTTFDTAAAIVGEVNGTPGATNDMPGRIVILCTPDGSATPGEVIRFASGLVTLADSVDIVLNTSTGSMIGTAANQKLGFFGATPVVQQAHIADMTDTSATDQKAPFNTLLDELEALGLIATS